MADGTKIEWTEATWNVINGCSVVSPGCTNCYAMRLAGTRMRHSDSRKGLTTEAKPGVFVWNGTVRMNPKVLFDPLHWRRPRKIFVCAHGDLFHEAVHTAEQDLIWAIMAIAERHTFQVLTKRPDRMRDYLRDPQQPARAWGQIRNISYYNFETKRVLERLSAGPLSNVWCGTSVEDQTRANERVPLLLETPAAIRYLSMEPLLGPVEDRGCLKHLDWVILGGESGPGARPMHPAWALSVRDQCIAAGVPFFFKQWGDWMPILSPWRRIDKVFHSSGTYEGDQIHHFSDDQPMVRVGKKEAGKMMEGREWVEYPNAA